MLRRLRSLGMCLVIAGSATGVTLAAPLVALGASNCPADVWPPALITEHLVTDVQVQVLAHCGTVRQAQVELILKRNGVQIAASGTITCTTSSGCNTNMVMAVAHRRCTSSNSSTYTSMYRTHPEDKFPWGPWISLPVRVLNCSV